MHKGYNRGYEVEVIDAKALLDFNPKGAVRAEGDTRSQTRGEIT